VSVLLAQVIALNGVHAAPGTSLFTFGGAALPPGQQIRIENIIFMAAVDSDVTLFLTPTIASALENRFVFVDELATDNELRGCIPVPYDLVTRIPWLLGATKTGAGNANVRFEYYYRKDIAP
jgi:hypothetical protein